jgi:alpha-tubulin suppressor-like RCC1 family protein
MKTKNVLLLPVLLLVSTAGFGLAQNVAGTAQIQGWGEDLSPVRLPLIAPMRVPAGSTFYTVQQGLENMPPLPFNPFLDLGLPVYFLGGTGYLVDDRTVDYRQLEAERIVAEVLAAGAKGPPTPTATISLQTLSVFYDASGAQRPYLTNMMSVPGAGSTATASFNIAGGTNFMPYDIVATTNVAAPVSSWTWLGVGYTANHYSFSGQPGGAAFYALARPSKTSVVGWGNNVVGQLDMPAGLSNAVSVVAGGGQSLALRSDGTAVAWGQNGFGQGAVPPDLTGLAMLAAGWQFDVALRTNGTVTAWGYNAPSLGYTLTNVPANLTNARVVSAQALHTLALRADGSLVAWGYDSGSGETQVPAGLTNLTAIAAGYQHNLAVRQNGTVAAWGNNASGQCTVPSGATNVWDVAAGIAHSLALRRDGTVVAWGGNSLGESTVPGGLSNVVAIAAGGDPTVPSRYSVALRSDGTVVAWGTGETLQTLGGLSNVVALAAGADHALAVRTGPPHPVFRLQPADQYQLAGGTATFTALGEPTAGIRYQWQFQGADLPGATNASFTLANTQAGNQGAYRAVASNVYGGVASTNAQFRLVVAPLILAKSPATNPVAYYQGDVALGVTVSSAGQDNGFPLSYQWRRNGTNIAGATAASYTFAAEQLDAYSVTVSNAAGNATANWQVAGINYGSLPYYLATNTAAYAAGRSGSVTDMRLVNNWTYAR